MTPNPTSDYARVERAIRFLDERRAAQPSLADVAHHVGLSASHFQRLFTRWAGISPKRFVQFQTAEVLKELRREWPRADIVPDQDATRPWIARAFPLPGAAPRSGLALHVKGTNFQLRVWRALLAIPDGALTTYGALAAAISAPDGSRAVGNA